MKRMLKFKMKLRLERDKAGKKNDQVVPISEGQHRGQVNSDPAEG